MEAKMINLLVHKLGRWYVREVCRREYSGRAARQVNERPVEYRFALEHLSRLTPSTVLDVGTGTTALPHLLSNCGFAVTAIDNIRDYWAGGDVINRHYHVIDDDIINTKLAEKFDFVTCISVLEHIPDHPAAVGSMFSLLNPGGYLALTFPYNEERYVENVYKMPESGYGRDEPYVCQVYSRAQVDDWLARNGGTLVAQEYWQMFTGELWTFGERLRPPVQVDREGPHHLSCLLLRKLA